MHEEPIVEMSRRCDVMTRWPDVYLPAIRAGKIAWMNPHKPSQKKTVSLHRRDVSCLSIWTKNPRPLRQTMENPETHDLLCRYNAIVLNFTLNTPDPVLEPGVCLPSSPCYAPFEDRLDDLRWVAKYLGPRAVVLRFDPICHYKLLPGHPLYGKNPAKGTDLTKHMFGPDACDNLAALDVIFRTASDCGINRVSTAFMRHDDKVVRNMTKAGVLPLKPSEAQRKLVMLTDFMPVAAKYGIVTRACTDQDYLDLELKLMPDVEDAPSCKVQKSACLAAEDVRWAAEHQRAEFRAKLCEKIHEIEPYDRIMALQALSKVKQKNSGQRKACNCCRAIDVGAYLPKCGHRCVYCYAQPGPYPAAEDWKCTEI